jgi:hypothetical protein
MASATAAQLLDWNVKRVQWRAEELGGRKIAGQLVFRESSSDVTRRH